VDAGYRGPFLSLIKERTGITLEVVERRDGGGKRRWLSADAEPPVVPRFAIVPRRWVERTFGWLGRFRRLSKDYEYLPATSESFIYLVMNRILLRSLTA
jgi:transposase